MRAIKLAFVATIVGFVLLTVVQSLTPFLPIAPLNEYRRPAPAPDAVGTLVHGDGRLASGINRWFDDRIGLRPFLTRLANQIDYSVFGYSRKVLIGRDGWLFERGTLDGLVFNERTAQDIELDRQKIDALAAFLRRTSGWSSSAHRPRMQHSPGSFRPTCRGFRPSDASRSCAKSSRRATARAGSISTRGTSSTRPHRGKRSVLSHRSSPHV